MSVAITLKLPEPISRKVDLEVPENVPVRHLTAALIQALRIPTVRAGWLVEYRMPGRSNLSPLTGRWKKSVSRWGTPWKWSSTPFSYPITEERRCGVQPRCGLSPVRL
jgi:hypothetical protein